MPKRPKKVRSGKMDREDGRPEVYDVQKAPDSAGYTCLFCNDLGHIWKKYDRGEIFLTHSMTFVCKEHLPDNVVIFDPKSGTCRDKSGQNVWKE